MSEKPRQRTASDWMVPVVVGMVLAGLIIAIYLWLWHVAILQGLPACNLGHDPPNDRDSHIARLGQIGDSFGVLTSLFAMLAFVLSWSTNRSQGKELKLQREQSQAQFEANLLAARVQLEANRRAAKAQLKANREAAQAQLKVNREAAYVQRLRLLRLEGEAYRDFLKQANNLLEVVDQLTFQVKRWANSTTPHATAEDRVQFHRKVSSLGEIIVLPFESSELDAKTREFVVQGIDVGQLLNRVFGLIFAKSPDASEIASLLNEVHRLEREARESLMATILRFREYNDDMKRRSDPVRQTP